LNEFVDVASLSENVNPVAVPESRIGVDGLR
jgi:hypothetical protein